MQLTQRPAIHWLRRSQLSTRRSHDHRRRVEIPCQGQVWAPSQCHNFTHPCHQCQLKCMKHSGQNYHQDLSIQKVFACWCALPIASSSSSRVCIPKREAFAAGNRLPHRCSDSPTKIGRGRQKNTKIENRTKNMKIGQKHDPVQNFLGLFLSAAAIWSNFLISKMI